MVFNVKSGRIQKVVTYIFLVFPGATVSKIKKIQNFLKLMARSTYILKAFDLYFDLLDFLDYKMT